ncbi:MAG: hypothetical protein AAB198_02820 [Actinomycetota bacterium]
MHRISALAVALVLLAAACGDDTADVTTTATSTSIDVAGLTDQIDALIEAAESVRGLTFIVQPEITIVTPDELADRIRILIEEDLEPDDVAVAQRLYEILGLLDGSVNLLDAYTALYAEQVGGFYDHETGEMVIMGGSELSPLSKSIVVHELVHALTDQHYGFGALSDELWDAGEFERVSAISSLAEGDATYFQLVYLETLTTAEQVDAVTESLAVDTSVMDSLPEWFAEDLTFPYDAGYGFVEQLITQGEVAAVNQAYELLPLTTEQILHPDKYHLREGGLPVEIPTVDIAGYTVFEEGTFGEWNTRLFLLDGIDPGDAVVASSGWGGDRYRIYWQGDPACIGDDCQGPVAFVYKFQGDTPRDAEELANAIADSGHAIMRVGSARSPVNGVTTFTGGDDFAYVRVSGKDVLFIAADDPAVGQALVAGLTG